MSESSVVEREIAEPQFKDFLPPVYRGEELTEEQEKFSKVNYVKEDLRSENPYLREYRPDNSYLILGVVMPDSFIAYSKDAPSHGQIWEAETQTNIPTIKGVNLTIDNLDRSDPSISLFGKKDLIISTIDFLIKSGYTEEASLVVSFIDEDGSRQRLRGKLGELNL